jgi:anti-repressor protein
MTEFKLIPVVPGNINGQVVQLVDARQLHEFLGVGRDFTTWIKERIAEFEFFDGEDFIAVSAPPIRGAGNRGKRTDYFLTLDMAKELAMVERTDRGRQARRYFIECERQLRQLHQSLPASMTAVTARLTREERQAINRQAWADVAGDAHSAFHARREALIQARAEAKSTGPVQLPMGFRPSWAR